MEFNFEEMGMKCLKQVRNRLYFKYKSLSPAIYRMPVKFVPPGTGIFGTNASEIYADPMSVIIAYQQSPDKLERLYLHMLFHCIYLHPFINSRPDNGLWSLALDVCCESAVMRLEPKDFDGNDAERKRIINKIKSNVKMMLPDLVHQEISAGYDVMKLASLFHMDDHLWLMDGQGGQDGQMNQDGQNGQNGQDDQNDQDDQNGQDGQNGQDDQDDQNEQKPQGNKSGWNGDMQNSKKKQEWSDVSRRIAADLQSFHTQGNGSGDLVQEIDYLTQDRMEYDEFLRQFAITEEKMMVNMDEFDYMYYTYGLSMPGRKLLVEPLEYKEAKVVKEFVIAIDTSGSCSGDLVQRFIRKTYSILKETESFSSRVNIHIVQCDEKVQNDTKITNQDEMELYMRNMKLYGFGGTDFRPVFEYVDTLIKNKEFENLCGLIYFTDGYGTYPKKPTPYKTAFAFLEDYQNREDIPSWAMSVFWKED